MLTNQIYFLIVDRKVLIKTNLGSQRITVKSHNSVFSIMMNFYFILLHIRFVQTILKWQSTARLQKKFTQTERLKAIVQVPFQSK